MEDREMRRIIRCLVIGFGVSNTAIAQAPRDRLSSIEEDLIKRAREPANVICREHIILVWPKDLKPRWYRESRVTNPNQMADWLEKAYKLSAHWTRFDPNKHYAERNHEPARLVFIHSGDGDFVFGGKRPFIGLRDLKDPEVGTEGWFGWLMHELSHDFWHEHPVFEKVKNPWCEAMCDYHRYELLLNLEMRQAAARWLQLLRQASPDDAYRGGAWMFLRLQRKNRLKDPTALWDYLRDKDFVATLGKPAWVK
jgi:hypothetical protein